MAKSLISLAKGLDFKTEHEYFDYMANSYVNGQFEQCRRLFKEMKKSDKKDFIMYVSDKEELKEIRNFYFQLL